MELMTNKTSMKMPKQMAKGNQKYQYGKGKKGCWGGTNTNLLTRQRYCIPS